MPLSPQEQQELEQLHAKFGGQQEQPAQGGLSPEEQAELQQLHAKFGGEAPAAPTRGYNQKVKEYRDYNAQEQKQPWGTRLSHLLLGDPNNPYQKELDRHVSPPVAFAPTASLPAAAVQVGNALSGSAPARMLTNGAMGGIQGAMQEPQGDETRVGNAAAGAAKGAGLGLVAEALSSAAGGVGRAWDTGKKAYQMATGSPALRAEAQDALMGSAQALRNRPERDQLATLIKGKTASINPDDYMGLHPEVDDIMSHARPNDLGPAVGATPSNVDMPLESVNKARQILDSNLPWKKYSFGTPLSAEVQDSGKAMAAKANALRDTVNGSSPDIASASDAVSKGIRGAEMLESGAKKPLSTLTTKNLDQRSLLAEALGSAGDEGDSTARLADVLRSAKKTASHPLTHGPLQVGWQGLKGAGESLGGESGAINNPVLLQLLQNQSTAK